MEFHSLSRKELQTLCKKNKIPANLTNVAMADSLANLSHVEGIEEIGNSQSVIQTPKTSRGSSRRPLGDSVSVVDKEPPNSSVRLTRNNQHDGKDLNENPSGLDMLKTPAVRTSSRRVLATSVSKVTDKDKSVAPRAYSTRRSARLIPDTIVSDSARDKGRRTRTVQISGLSKQITDDDLSKEETKGASLEFPDTESDTVKASADHLKCVADVSATGSSLTEEVTLNNDSLTIEAVNVESGETFTSDGKSLTFNAEISDEPSLELPECASATEENPNLVTGELAMDIQANHRASGDEASSEVLDDVEPQKAPAVDNFTLQDSNGLEVEDAYDAEVSVELPEYSSSSVVASASEEIPNTVGEDVSNDEASLKVLINIKTQKAPATDDTILEDNNDLAGEGPCADDKSLASDDEIFNEHSVEIPEYASSMVASPTLEKANAASKALAMEVQICDKASGYKDVSAGEASSELVTDIMPQNAHSLDNSTLEESNDLVAEGATADNKSLVSDAVELPLEGKLDNASEESAVEIQVTDKVFGCKDASEGEAYSKVLAAIELPQAFAVDSSTIEDSDNLKGGAFASPKDDQDNIHLEDDFESVISVSAQVPSNGVEKAYSIGGEESVVSGADAGQALITGDDSFNADANQILSQIGDAHQAVTGVDVGSTDQVVVPRTCSEGPDYVTANFGYSPAKLSEALSESRHLLSKSKLTPKSSNKKKGTPVSKMVLNVLDEDKENGIAGATEEKEKAATAVSKMATCLADDNKENDTMLNMLVAEEKENNTQDLQKASLRKLRKIVKEKLEKARPALQSLTENCLAEN